MKPVPVPSGTRSMRRAKTLRRFVTVVMFTTEGEACRNSSTVVRSSGRSPPAGATCRGSPRLSACRTLPCPPGAEEESESREDDESGCGGKSAAATVR